MFTLSTLRDFLFVWDLGADFGDDDMTGGWSIETKDVSEYGSVLVLDRLGMEISDMLSSKEGWVEMLFSAE